MKKSFLLITMIALSILANKAKAQHYNNTYREDSWHVTIGPDVYGVVNNQQLVRNNDIPQTNNGYVTYSRLGLGAQLHVEYYPSPFVGLTLGTGIVTAAGNIPKAAKSYVLIPFKIGAKAFFSQVWYLKAEAGLGYTQPTYNGSSMAKIISPSLGYNDNDNGWDISLSYDVNHMKDNYISMFGLHIAYSFDLTSGY